MKNRRDEVEHVLVNSRQCIQVPLVLGPLDQIELEEGMLELPVESAWTADHLPSELAWNSLTDRN